MVILMSGASYSRWKMGWSVSTKAISFCGLGCSGINLWGCLGRSYFFWRPAAVSAEIGVAAGFLPGQGKLAIGIAERAVNKARVPVGLEAVRARHVAGPRVDALVKPKCGCHTSGQSRAARCRR